MNVRENIDFNITMEDTIERLNRINKDHVNSEQAIYLLSKEIDSYREKIERLTKDNIRLESMNKKMNTEIDGLKEENNYLYYQLKEKTENINQGPAVQINIANINVGLNDNHDEMES